MTRRPVHYSPEIAARICAMIAGGLGLRAVSRAPGMPHKATILGWVAGNAQFRELYVKAGEARGLLRAERIVDLVDDVIARRLTPDAGRVAIDALKWLAAREAHKIYGDRVAHDVSGSVTHEIVESRRSVEGKLADLEREIRGEGPIPLLPH